MKRLIVLLALLVIAGCSPQKGETSKPASPAVAVASTGIAYSAAPTLLDGLCINFFSGIENPACGPYPTLAEINRDLRTVRPLTKKLRFYSCQHPLNFGVNKAHELGFEVLPSAWIGRIDKLNLSEIKALEATTRTVNCRKVIVGSEVLLRHDQTPGQLISWIRQVKRDLGPKVEVGYADMLATWASQPELAKEVDFIVVHIYAYWDGIAIDRAASYVCQSFERLRQLYPGKNIILGETGWPKSGSTKGQAVPSLANQRRFINEFAALAKAEHIPYYYFEAFDEAWKRTMEGDVGDVWGDQDLTRPANFTSPVINQFPFTVGGELTAVSHFVPSGWMGEGESGEAALKFDPKCQKSPHSGRSCLKISYHRLSYPCWAGIYWQYPENNWGQLPGYQFQGVKRLTFWIRGDKGGEVVECKVGGITGKKYEDTLEPAITTGKILLTKNWQKHTLAIARSNLDCVISGFCIVFSYDDNRDGLTIYLDDIQFE